MIKPKLPAVLKPLAIIFFIFVYSIANYSQSTNYDVKFSAEYVLKDIKGNEINRMKLFRNGTKLKFTKVDNKGKDNETTTDIYIFKDEQKVYSIVSSKKAKFGGKHSLDMTYIGMLTGVYIFDMGNDGSIFNSSTQAGTGSVLGNECVLYDILVTADGKSEYYMYQDNLMLKRFAGTSTDGSTLEAISYDSSTDVPESIFVIPDDVQYIDN
jgi:hypothetical protein